MDTAASSASAAGNVADAVVSSAGSVMTNAGSMAGSVLQPLVFDPLRRLQGGVGTGQIAIEDKDRLWIAVDGMGGDHAPGTILEGCLTSVLKFIRLPILKVI